jgi:hypothetical protein
VDGTVESIVNRPQQRSVLIQTAASPDPLDVVLAGTSHLAAQGGTQIRLTDLSVGDHIHAVGVPSPDRALVYLGQSLTDLDLRYDPEQSGFVVQASPSRATLLVQVAGSGRERVRLQPGTAVRGAPSLRRLLKSLRPGDPIVLAGLVNDRLATMVRTSSIQVYPLKGS